MITIVCSSQYPLDEFKKHVIKTSGLYDKIEFLGYENKGEFSLTEIYNRGLKEAKYKHVVFCHPDITIETKQWGNKLIKLFDKNPEYGIIGVAGSKNMPVSGQWWENRNKMYGRVQHTHEGKTWLSAYSEDLGQELEEVVVCDGVWFAVDKTRLKKEFNEEVEGFHFYDVTFTFENYLQGVKVGVTTAVRINHQSIGMTNEAWEINRQNFAETFKDNLPIDIKRVLHKNQKLKIMLSSLSFNGGSVKDLIMLQIATELKKMGHEVTIASLLGGPLDKGAKKHGIKLAPIQEPPGYKIGDGKWVLNTANGQIPSVDKTLYKLFDNKFDIIHVFSDELVSHLKKLYPDNSVISTVFTDGLFLQENENADKTIFMKTDLTSTSQPEFYKNIIKNYEEVL